MATLVDVHGNMSSSSTSTPSPPPSNNLPSHTSNNKSQAAEETNYMPDVLKYLETCAGPEPIVPCTICCISKIAIPGFQNKGRTVTGGANGSGQDDDNEWEQAYTLPCGHIFGLTCFTSPPG
ncbi:hypothetical protein N658DRAFT_510018 [Parathielavia hyrcaniae]|uniref:Uncharacterized protein n=1 Tax=Parathielavia hyrcaniae TaxID=113614 RepID=A0AAN6PYL7_9PEZI|nr:hypothetical protein N658DRAFT_510018 [Parathielavia hyrcaniae]